MTSRLSKFSTSTAHVGPSNVPMPRRDSSDDGSDSPDTSRLQFTDIPRKQDLLTIKGRFVKIDFLDFGFLE